MKSIIFMIFFFYCWQDLTAKEQKDLLSNIAFEQHIGAHLNDNLTFINEEEKPTNIKTLLRERPGIFVFSYSHCQTLCPMVINDLDHSLAKIKRTAGQDYTVLFLSIDPNETQKNFKERKKGWNYLRGNKEQIQQLARTLGFSYQYDPNSKQYAHPAGLVFLTPTGVVSSYLLGVRFESEAIAKALSLAEREKKGNLVESILLYCFHYDPQNGKYGSLIVSAMKASALLTLALLACGLLFLNRRRA